MCSGGGNSKAEQQSADQQRAQENALMQQQLQMQMNQIASVNASLDPIIANGGMSQDQQAALTSLALNNIPQQFNNVAGQINQNLVARGITGGGMAGSGDIARNFGQLGAMEAGLQQQSLSNIQIQKQQQLMQALGAKMGVANLFGQNTGTFNSGAQQALGSGVTAAGNADTANASMWGSILGAATAPFSFSKGL